MNTPAQYRQVLVSTIDLTDNRYTLNPFACAEPDEALAESIRAFGMLHPPLLLEIDSNNFIVLSGKKRVQIAAQQVDAPLTALVIQKQEKNAGQQLLIFTTLLQHQLVGSPLSLIEQAIFFQKALESLTAKEVNTLLPLLGYKPKPHIPHQLIALLNLDLSVQQGLHKGFLSQRAGKKLEQFPHSDQQTLVALIKELQLGGSKQQQLIDSVIELTKRLHIKAEQLLNRWRDQEKSKNSQSNKPQQAASLLNWLRQESRPNLAAAEEGFGQFQRQLDLPTGVRLSHTLSFEDEQVTLSIDFSSKKNLAEQWQPIEALLKKGEL